MWLLDPLAFRPAPKCLGRLLVGRGIERHRRPPDRMPGGDTSGESPCVVASPAQFSDGSATNLKSADAINDDRPVPRQLLDPLCQRGRSVHGGTAQHVGASWQVSRLTEIEQYRSPLLRIVKRGVQFLGRNPRLVLRRRAIGQEKLV